MSAGRWRLVFWSPKTSAYLQLELFPSFVVGDTESLVLGRNLNENLGINFNVETDHLKVYFILFFIYFKVERWMMD